MKLIVSIGPDYLGVNYKSKASVRRALKNAMRRIRPYRKDTIDYSFKGRRYSWLELNEAVVLTLNEFHSNCINK